MLWWELCSLSWVAIAILVTYFGVLACLSVLALHRWTQVRRVLREESRTRAPAPPGSLPRVTVQLPVYNEAGVAVRLLERATALDYPRELLEIQVLDDSTDQTQALLEAAVEQLRAEGHPVRYLHRERREGYKAGALAAGLLEARGELVALFDADFLPDPGFLLELVGEFQDPRVGMVQARWVHQNADTSLLTRVQGVMLDGHFLIEHEARQRGGFFFNFNGTAGIWRRQAILEAGGWTADTLTEDLDLSYRAQLCGWRFVYRGDVTVPAELPASMAAFVGQQRRWLEGGAQTARKLLPPLLRAPLAPRPRLEALLHLLSGAGFAFLFLLELVSIPTLVLRLSLQQHGRLHLLLTLLDVAILVCSTGGVLAFYVVSQRLQGRSWGRSLGYLPGLLAVGMGIAPVAGLAWCQGLWRRGGEFVRTPKRGARPDGPQTYRPRPYRWLGGLDLLLACAFLWAGGGCLRAGLWSPLVFVGLFTWGLLYVGVETLAEGPRVLAGSRSIS